MELRCHNNQGRISTFSLTIGADYEVLENEVEEVDFLYVINDKGNKGRYNKKYFQEIPPEVIEDSTNLINTNNGIFINGYRDGNSFNIDLHLNTTGTSISCGVMQVYNVNTFVNELVFALPNETLEFYNSIFSQALKNQANIDPLVGQFIISTNTNFEFFNIIEESLDNIAGECYTCYNPNSENQICTWIIDCNLLRD